MENSRKSFKTLSMTKPIKKEIDDTLTKLQMEKRKFLALERQQLNLKEQTQKARRQLNDAKFIEPKTRVQSNKNAQTNVSIGNADRIYLNTVNKISQYRSTIDTHRCQIKKYKKLSNELIKQIQALELQNIHFEQDLQKRQQKTELIKEELWKYRQENKETAKEFRSSYQALQRQSSRQENQRKKSQALRKSFYGDDLKISKLINISQVQKPSSSTIMSQYKTVTDNFMTNSVPLIKQRVRMIIHNNRQKLKISQSYKKFGQDLLVMFGAMKQYKGRQDVQFIAQQFVMKEKQLKKIEEYIGKLQNRLMGYQQQIQKVRHQDQQLRRQLSGSKSRLRRQGQYTHLCSSISSQIQVLHAQQQQNTRWFKSIEGIMKPVMGEETLSRRNVDQVLGNVEDKWLKGEITIDRRSPIKQTSTSVQPTIDQKQIKAYQSMELMSYDRLKQYAKDYLGRK